MSTYPRRLEISAEKIINAIKCRPALYNKSDPNYFVMNRYKGKLWKEVCKEIFDNWDQMKAHQKVECDYDLRKRWKNLRTAFTREVALQKKEREEGNVRLRKVYAHFDQMSFLLNPDVVKVTDPESIRDDSNVMEESEESNDFQVDNDGTEAIVVKPEEDEIEEGWQEEEITVEPIARGERSFREKILGVLEDMRKADEDEDKQFMMSLVPSLRKLDAKQKFTAKIAILNVLKDVTFQEQRGD